MTHPTTFLVSPAPLRRRTPRGSRGRRLAVAAAAIVLLAGCGGYDDTTVPEAQPASPAPAAPNTLEPCDNDGTEVRSYEPDADETDNDEVVAIRERGKLVAGVAADTLLLGARNQAENQIQGFDIDMVYAIADAIFPEEGREALDARNRVDLKVITAAQRIPLLQDGTIDIVARNMTVNCSRWQQIAFSEIYYNAGQKVLVGVDSGISTIADLAGKRICAPAGTTSIENIQVLAPEAIPVTSTDNSACMVLFQNGDADGVSTDDTVLAGLAAQDPYATVLKTDFLTKEPYGIGVNQDNVGLVQLINRVLEDMRRDGRWKASYDRWLEPELQVEGKQPPPRYGR
ncbi:glutamate ABC transporter substrate-binding protein [Nocardioides sp.]|uniref:glutamate ABC transporter substrate-binding protein n=1 Tax=Nocardioides sp. TaxID=35761 RepID=UPI00271D1979|nr:glutamate ABC transporter substrate-binding protein [Nocardioides sp.]MDO9456640.1 glutamate ABC transporter substrate-binding protein [Nocardioides sp.]